MINNRKRWRYVGVLHEYIECMEGAAKNFFLAGDYYINHGTTGDRGKDPLKFSKDAAVLEKAFKELDVKDGLRNRYAFYCANSYKDANETDRAIVWYKITISLDGGWDQEKYRACIMLYELFKQKNKMEEALFFALQSYKFDKTRVEGIYKLVQFYCSNGMNDIAMTFYKLIENWYENNYLASNGNPLVDKLFVDIMDYDFYLPYFMIIISDHSKNHQLGVKMYSFIFNKKKIGPEWFMKNLLHNFKFFVQHIENKNKKEFIINAKEYLKFLEDSDFKVGEVFYTSLYELISSVKKSQNKS